LEQALFAQQDALFTQYMFNNLYMTPAFAGVDGVTRLLRYTAASGWGINQVSATAVHQPRNL
jgi:hypothetical protein